MSEGPAFDAPLSASKLKTFDRCPEQFRLKYIERMEPAGKDTHYIRRGNAVHEALESMLKTTSRLDDPDYVFTQAASAYRDNGGQQAYGLTDENHRFVLDCLRVAGRTVAKFDPEVVSVEARLPFDVNDIDHAPGFDGYADVITETEVWDWKTGSSEDKELDEVLQGATYMAGFTQHMGRPPESVRFFYLKDEVGRSYEPSDEMFDTMREKAQALLRAADTSMFPAQPDDSKCYWCDFEVHCSASPTGGGDLTWRNYP